MKKIYFLLIVGIFGLLIKADAQIAAWDFNGALGNEATIAATTLNANLAATSVSRGPGILAASLANTYHSNDFTLNGTFTDAINNGDYVQFTVAANATYQTSLSTLDANFRRSSTGPNTFQWQYSLDGFSTAGINIGTAISFTNTAPGGVAQAQIDLSVIPAMQNVVNPSIITFRLYGYGATNVGGTFSFGRPTTPLNDIAIGGTVTITGGSPPDILLSSSNPAIIAGNIQQGSTNNPIYRFDLAVTTASATLNGVTINTAGTYTASDITNFKCWYSADNIFNSGSDFVLSTKTAGLGAGTHIFPSFTNQVIGIGTTGYIFITTDVTCAAVVANNISVSPITTADISFVSGNKTGSAFAGGLQTIIVATPNNVTTPAASVANASSSLSWTNPAGCFDDVMIVAATAPNTWAPVGTTYTTSLVYGAGDPLGNGFAVYQGTISPQTVTGLTNGTPYYYKFFTRLGNTWSAGIEVTATPAVVTLNTDYFRSKITGDWNLTSTWESSNDNATWMNATLTPDENANIITVRNTHVVTIALPVTADQLVIEPTATLTLAAIFTVADGAGTDVSVDGTVINALLAGNHVVTGTIVFNAGSLYQHVRDGGNVLTATWALTSTAEITGIILATTLNCGNQTFGNFTWNSIGQTTNLNLTGTLATINGNFRVQNTGTASLRMTATAALNLVVGGNYTVEANHNLDNSGTGATSVSIGGNFAHTGGVFESTGPVVPITMTGVGRTFTQSGGTFNNANLNWIVNVGAEITLNSNLPLATSRTLTIDGILNCGVLAVNGTGAITVTNGGRARVGSLSPAGAVNDNLSATGGLTLNTGSTIEFNGSAAQFAAARTFSNLEFNNAAGATLIGAVLVNNTLGLTSGLVTTSATNLLTMAAGSSYTGGTTNSNYVRGPIKKIGNTPFVFPVGQTVPPDGGIAQIGIGNIAGLPTDEFIAEYRRGSARALGPISAVGLTSVSGCDYWTLDNTSGTPTVDITCYWSSNNTCNGAVYVTILADLVIAHFNGTSWDAFGTVGTATGSPASGTVVWTGVSTFSPFSLGGINFNNPLPITINYFTGARQNGNHLLNWKVTCVSTPSATIELERSTDGRNYNSIYSIFATAVRCQQPFDYSDNAPAKGVNYYRLKMTDVDGKLTYSSIVSLINASKGMDVMNIAPNPIVNGAFNLKISSAEKMQMELVVIDMQGRVMMKQSANMIAGFNVIPVNVKQLAAGTYQLFGNTADGRTRVLRFVVQ